MKLELSGHNYKYAVEQIMLALFPDERPKYEAVDAGSALGPQPLHTGLSELSAQSHLSFGDVYAQAVTVIRRGDEISRGASRIMRNKMTDKLMTDRLLQRIIKQSFFRAAQKFLDSPPVWGSLTGIRPAQIAASALTAGKSAQGAAALLTNAFYVAPERAELCIDAARSALCIKQSLEPMDIALYVGIPFCPSRCAYCSFVSNSVEKSFGLVKPFMQALLCEIGEMAALVDTIGLRPIAVYIGGGTPTALPPDDFNTLLKTLGESFEMASIREYTVEAGRPDTITEQKLEIMRLSGVQRICVNPQSMSDEVLKAIGRRHTAEDVVEAVRLVKTSGMSLNMDIIAGLPEDTTDGFQHSLDSVLELEPENITVHTLSLKKGSRIMLEGAKKPSGADVSGMLGYASRRLRESGMSPYYLYRQKYSSGGFENTGWCLPGHEGIYNVCMMEDLCTVLSLGGGAVTKLVSQGGRIERIFNAKYPQEYIVSKPGKLAEKVEKFKRLYKTENRLSPTSSADEK